jgi:hypothetical protein
MRASLDFDIACHVGISCSRGRQMRDPQTNKI